LYRMLTDILAFLPVAVYRDSVISRTKVGYVKKPQVCCNDKVGHLATSSFDGSVHMLCRRAALLKLKLVLCFEIIKNIK